MTASKGLTLVRRDAMKSKSILRCGTALLLLLLVTANRARATVVTYNYIGSHYTVTNAPNEPGFMLSDHITATITLDSASWGMQGFALSGNLQSGPYSAFDTGTVTTDATGNILTWNLTGSIPGLDIDSGGNLDGSGVDNIFGDRPSGGVVFDSASVSYGIGSRTSGSNGWTMASPVPEPATVGLLTAGALVCWLRRKRANR
jgi:hypothetical protein